MFTSDQRALLEGKLDKANVKSRRGANGKAVAYLEAWHVIDVANEVFGFGNWDAETVEMTSSSQRAAWNCAFEPFLMVLMSFAASSAGISLTHWFNSAR